MCKKFQLQSFGRYGQGFLVYHFQPLRNVKQPEGKLITSYWDFWLNQQINLVKMCIEDLVRAPEIYDCRRSNKSLDLLEFISKKRKNLKIS